MADFKQDSMSVETLKLRGSLGDVEIYVDENGAIWFGSGVTINADGSELGFEGNFNEGISLEERILSSNWAVEDYLTVGDDPYDVGWNGP